MPTTPAARADRRAPSAFWPIVASCVGVALIVALVVAFSESQGYSEVNPASDEAVESNATGEGTNPDGLADQPEDTEMEGTEADEIIESGAVSEEGEPTVAPEPVEDGESIAGDDVQEQLGVGEDEPAEPPAEAGDATDGAAEETTADE